MIRHRAETWLTDIWYERAKPPVWLRAFAWLHNAFRLIGLLGQPPRKTKTLQVPIIIVGNITVGGTGKTPLVISMANALAQAGWQVGIVMRGYKHSQIRQRPGLVSTDTDPKLCGDEALLISRSAGVPVWVGKDRSACVQQAMNSGAEVILCDDGLQNGKLERSYEICVIDGARGLGNEQLLPAGPLREPISRLDSVDQILIKGRGFSVTQAHARFELVPQCIFHPLTQTEQRLSQWADQEVIALCGIANPASFKMTLEGLGLRVSLVSLGDHHEYCEADFMGLEGAKAIVVTEKDWVKIERLALDGNQLKNIYVLKVSAEIDANALDRVLSHARSYQVNE